MKDKLFKLVGGASYFLAVISLVLAIVLGSFGGMSFFGGVDEDIEMPSIEIDDYIADKVLQAASQSDSSPSSAVESSKSASAKDDEYQNDLKVVLDRIMNSLSNFTNTTKQDTANKEGLEKYLIEKAKKANREQYLEFLSLLGDEMKVLEGKAEEIASIADTNDPQYIDWSKFVTWYADTYMKNFNDEKKRIVEEKVESQVDSARGLTMLAGAGSAFMTFVMLVLIMLLVRIETNTRKVDV